MSNRRRDTIAMGVALATIISVLSSTGLAAPRPSHFWLCAHHDWAAKTGYFLVLENSFDDGAPSKLADAHLVLAIGDGHDFRYIKAPTTLTLDRDYSVKAAINAGSAEFFVDGQSVGKSDGRFVPTGPLQANTIPAFVSVRVLKFSFSARPFARNVPAGVVTGVRPVPICSE